MALSAKDRTDIAELVAHAVATALAAQATASAPATGKAADTFRTRAQVREGKGFPCTAPEPCTRTLSTLKRAAKHGVADGGHEPR